MISLIREVASLLFAIFSYQVDVTFFEDKWLTILIDHHVYFLSMILRQAPLFIAIAKPILICLYLILVALARSLMEITLRLWTITTGFCSQIYR